MKGLPVAVAIGGMALLTLFALDRSCASNRALEKAKSDYAEQVRVLEADNAIKRDAILKAEETITQQDVAIGRLTSDIDTKNARITLLSGQLANIVGQEPSTTPEIESLPIVINLRAQVARLTEMFSVSQQLVSQENEIIKAWETKFAAQVEITSAWKARYDNEHTLRIACEGLVGKYEHARKSGIWKTVGYAAGAFALGYVIAK